MEIRFKFMKLLLVLILASTSITSCATPSKGPGPSPFNKDKILRLINEARSKPRTCGSTRMAAVSPLTWNDKLELAAQKHSSEMNQYNYFSHTSRNGANAGERLTAIGYAWKTYGENIGQGFRSEEEAVEEW